MNEDRENDESTTRPGADGQIALTLDPDGTVRRVDDRVLSGAGVDAGTVVGAPFSATPWVARSGATADQADEWVRRARTGESVAFELPYPDGAFAGELLALRGDADDGPGELLAVLRGTGADDGARRGSGPGEPGDAGGPGAADAGAGASGTGSGDRRGDDGGATDDDTTAIDGDGDTTTRDGDGDTTTRDGDAADEEDPDTTTIDGGDDEDADATDDGDAGAAGPGGGATGDASAAEDRLARYRAALDAGGDMVLVTDADGEVALVTGPLADRLGYDRAEVVGRRAIELLGGASAAAADGGLTDRLADSEGEGAGFETVVETADGDALPVEVELSPYPGGEGAGGVVAVFRNISELAAARGELDAERERFSQLLEGVPDPAVEARFDGDVPVIRQANTAFRETFAGSESVEGRPVDEVVLPPADLETGAREEAETIDRRVWAGDSVTTDVRRETVDGLREFRLRVFPVLTDGGQVRRALAIYTDVTDRRRRERRLQVTNRVLRHNVRNRMSVVLGYADQLRAAVDASSGEFDAGADVDVVEALDALREGAESVVELSRKARDGQRALRQTDGGPVDLSWVVADVVAACERDCEADVEVRTTLPDRAPVAAGRGIRGAVENLVENALVHGAPPVEVTVDVDEDRVTLRVADAGPGLPVADRRVLDGEADTSQLEHGSGLGLWIVRWVVRACGGRVTVEDGDGTAVVVTLRRAEGDPDPDASLPPPGTDREERRRRHRSRG